MTESKGLRARISSALVACSWLVAAGAARGGGGGAAGSAEGSSATLEATSDPMPDAWKYAAAPMRRQTTATKYRLKIASKPMRPGFSLSQRRARGKPVEMTRVPGGPQAGRTRQA